MVFMVLPPAVALLMLALIAAFRSLVRTSDSKSVAALGVGNIQLVLPASVLPLSAIRLILPSALSLLLCPLCCLFCPLCCLFCPLRSENVWLLTLACCYHFLRHALLRRHYGGYCFDNPRCRRLRQSMNALDPDRALQRTERTGCLFMCIESYRCIARADSVLVNSA